LSLGAGPGSERKMDGSVRITIDPQQLTALLAFSTVSGKPLERCVYEALKDYIEVVVQNRSHRLMERAFYD
jgi:hypothetical protein